MMKQFLLTLLLISFVAGQPGSQYTYTTSWFLLKYERSVSSRDARITGEMLDSSLATLTRRLNLSLNKKIDGYLFSSSDHFRKETRSRLFDDGLWKGNVVYLVTARGSNDETKAREAVARVVGRMLLAQLRSCPSWLAEAYSLYAGNALARFGPSSSSHILSFDDLTEDFARAERLEDQKELYAKLAATMSFLINRYGESKVDALFTQFKSGSSLEQAFESTFGEKIEVIEQEWVRALTPASK